MNKMRKAHAVMAMLAVIALVMAPTETVHAADWQTEIISSQQTTTDSLAQIGGQPAISYVEWVSGVGHTLKYTL